MANPTYQSGFYAPGRGTAKYPALWDGCVGAWNPGLGNTGLSLRDWGPKCRNGTIINPTPSVNWDVSDGIRNLKLLKASSHYVDCGTASAFGLSSSFSVTGWIRPSNVTVWQRWASVGEYDTGWIAGVTVSGKLDLTVVANAIVPCYGQTTLTPGVWTAVAVVADNISKTLAVYVNGKLDVAPVSFTGTILRPSASFLIGRSGVSSTYDWSGGLTDIRLYEKTITQSQIRLLAQRPGIAYELAPRKFYSLPAAAGNPAGILQLNTQSMRFGL
jgi:hypothetical protein